MSDDWMNRLHPDMQRLLNENLDAVQQATQSGHTMLDREVTNRDLELQQQAARVEALTLDDIRQNVETPPGRDVPEGSRETWDYSEPNFAPRVLDESQSQTQETPDVPEPEPDYNAMRAADHEQSEYEARLEREKPDEVKDAELEANFQDYLNDHPEEAEQWKREEEERQRREQERERGDD